MQADQLRWHLAHSVDIFGSALLDDATATAGGRGGLPAIGLHIGDGDRALRRRGPVLEGLRGALSDATEVLQTGVRTVPIYVFSVLGRDHPMVFESNRSVAMYASRRQEPPGRTQPGARALLTAGGHRPPPLPGRPLRCSVEDAVLVVQSGASTAADAARQALAALDASLLTLLGGVVPFASETDVTWVQGAHPFVPWSRTVGAHRHLSTLVTVLARRNRVLSRLAVASAILDDLDAVLADAFVVRAPGDRHRGARAARCSERPDQLGRRHGPARHGWRAAPTQRTRQAQQVGTAARSEHR